MNGEHKHQKCRWKRSETEYILMSASLKDQIEYYTSQYLKITAIKMLKCLISQLIKSGVANIYQLSLFL